MNTGVGKSVMRANELVNTPLVPGTRIEVLAGSQVDIVFDDDTQLELTEGDVWEYLSSSYNDDWITMRSQVENGSYHASFDDIYSASPLAQQRQSLFHPQSAADIFGVDVSLPSSISVPVGASFLIDF
jgi:hypothetical protein